MISDTMTAILIIKNSSNLENYRFQRLFLLYSSRFRMRNRRWHSRIHTKDVLSIMLKCCQLCHHKKEDSFEAWINVLMFEDAIDQYTISFLDKLFYGFYYVFIHVEPIVTHSSWIHLFCHVFIGVSLLVCPDQIFSMTYVYHFICLAMDYE